MTWLRVVCELARRYQLLGRSRTDPARDTDVVCRGVKVCCERTGAASAHARSSVSMRDAARDMAAGCVQAREALPAALAVAHRPGTRHCRVLPRCQSVLGVHGSSKRPRRATTGKRDAARDMAAGCVRARLAALALLALAHIPGTRHCSDLPALVQQQRARDSDHSEGHAEELKLIRGTADFFSERYEVWHASKKKPTVLPVYPTPRAESHGTGSERSPCRFCCLQIVLCELWDRTGRGYRSQHTGERGA